MTYQEMLWALRYAKRTCFAQSADGKYLFVGMGDGTKESLGQGRVRLVAQWFRPDRDFKAPPEKALLDTESGMWDYPHLNKYGAEVLEILTRKGSFRILWKDLTGQDWTILNPEAAPEEPSYAAPKVKASGVGPENFWSDWMD